MVPGQVLVPGQVPGSCDPNSPTQLADAVYLRNPPTQFADTIRKRSSPTQSADAIYQRNSPTQFHRRISPTQFTYADCRQNSPTQSTYGTRRRNSPLQSTYALSPLHFASPSLDLESVPAGGHPPQGRILKGGHAPGRTRWPISREALYVI